MTRRWTLIARPRSWSRLERRSKLLPANNIFGQSLRNGRINSMRKPSSRILDRCCDIYAPIDGGTQDTIGGPTWNYPSTPTAARVPCTAQVMEYEEIEDAQERVTQITHWKIMFGSYQAVAPRAMILYTDRAGVLHTLIVNAQRDNADRGSAYTVRATERV